MKSKAAFSKKDFIVVLACVVFLLINLGAVGAGSRQRAKEVVCLSNLRQWGIVCQMYTESNDGLFWSGINHYHVGYWWPWQLEDRLKNWKINRIWFCPMAKIPLVDENGIPSPTLYIFNAWGIYGYNNSECHTDANTKVKYCSGANGINGSYGLNGYVLSIPPGNTFENTGITDKDGWRTPNVPGASNVPVFVDSIRFDVWPLPANSPPAYEFQPWSSNNMAKCCINRHNGAVNVLFMDWSARKVGLKELWTLKWHKSFDTMNPYTLAGGTIPDDWPQWMQNFKGY